MYWMQRLRPRISKHMHRHFHNKKCIYLPMYRHTPSSFDLHNEGTPVIRWIWCNSFPCIITKKEGFTRYNILVCTESKSLWWSPIKLDNCFMIVLLNNIVMYYYNKLMSLCMHVCPYSGEFLGGSNFRGIHGYYPWKFVPRISCTV